MSKKTDAQSGKFINELDENIFVALFHKGANEYLEEIMTDDDTNPKECLSKPSEKRIMKLINRQIHKEKAGLFVKRLPRIAVIIFIVIVVCAITIISVEAFRIPVFNFFINKQEEITDIKINDELSPNDEEIKTSHTIEPSYLPEGFELTKTEEFGTGFFKYYNSAEGNSIIIQQHAIGSDLSIDTENAEYGSIDINEHEGFYSIKNGSTQLVFSTNEQVYLIIAELDISEVFRIAKSIY